MNVFLPSLPGMARDFQVDYGVMQLSVSAYIGASAVLQLLGGPLSDRFGRRPVVIWGLIGFLLATVGTLLATRPPPSLSSGWHSRSSPSACWSPAP